MTTISNLSKNECQRQINAFVVAGPYACRANQELFDSLIRRVRKLEKAELASAVIAYPPTGTLLKQRIGARIWAYDGVDEHGWVKVSNPDNPRTKRRFRPQDLNLPWPCVEMR